MAKIWKSHKGPTWALEAYIAFVSFMKNVQSISTHIHALVLIIFGLVFVKSNMISNTKLIVTNLQMWKDLGLSGPGWPFVWG